MSFFNDNYQKVAIFVQDVRGNTLKRVKPEVDSMRTAHKIGRNLTKKYEGHTYNIIQLHQGNDSLYRS